MQRVEETELSLKSVHSAIPKGHVQSLYPQDFNIE